MTTPLPLFYNGYWLNKWFTYINITPIRKQIIVFFFSLYFKAVGSNSIVDIYVIIPAIIANIAPMIVVFIIGFKKRNARIAPRGSDIPDISVRVIAFFLLLVA